MSDDVFNQLYRAIKRGNVGVVSEYLARGGDPNLHTRYGWTLLMAAAFKGSSGIAALLLEHGADLHATNKAGETSLALAAAGGFPKLVRLLLGQGARLDIQPLGWSFPAYMRYARSPSAAVSKLLADAGLPNHALQRTETGHDAGSEFRP